VLFTAVIDLPEPAGVEGSLRSIPREGGESELHALTDETLEGVVNTATEIVFSFPTAIIRVD